MAYTPKTVQATAVDLNPLSVYSPAVGTKMILKLIHICNHSAAAAAFRLFLDHDGTTYDETTDLEWDVDIEPGQSWTGTYSFLGMTDDAGNLAYRTSVANALTITVSGMEIT